MAAGFGAVVAGQPLHARANYRRSADGVTNVGEAGFKSKTSLPNYGRRLWAPNQPPQTMGGGFGSKPASPNYGRRVWDPNKPPQTMAGGFGLQTSLPKRWEAGALVLAQPHPAALHGVVDAWCLPPGPPGSRRAGPRRAGPPAAPPASSARTAADVAQQRGQRQRLEYSSSTPSTGSGKICTTSAKPWLKNSPSTRNMPP